MSELSLSLFSIVKNEAKTVWRMLDSVVSVADEFVIGIDRRSSDGTKALIEEFAKEHPEKSFKIYDFTWSNDFSKARNAAIRKCSGDWILQLDGHEYLHRQSAAILKRLLNEIPEHIWLVAVRMYLEPIWSLGTSEGNEIPEIWFMQPHLWRNGKGIKYEGKSHNQISLKICPIEHRLRTPDIVIVHDRPRSNAAERKVQREKMNTPYFKGMLEDNPEDERGLFYSAMGYVDAAVESNESSGDDYNKDYLEKAIPFAQEYIKQHSTSRPEEAFEMASKLGEILAVFERWEEAREAFIKCITLAPLRAEGYYNLGQICLKRIEQLWDDYAVDGRLQEDKKDEYTTRLFQLYNEASKWLKIAADTAPPVTSYYLRAPVYLLLPNLKLAELNENIYRFTGQDEYFLKALSYYQEVKKIAPHNLEVIRSTDLLQEKFKKIKGLIMPGGDRKRIAIFNVTGQFSDHLSESWKRYGYDVKTWRRPSTEGLAWANVVLCGWADEAASIISAQNWDADLYIRLCRYEAYSDMPRKINWENVKSLLVPSNTMANYVNDSFDIATSTIVMNHGLELEKYDFRERNHGDNVAFIAYINARKNLNELADIIIATDKKFHIAGQVQHKDLWRYFWWKLRRHGSADRVSFHGWQNDVNAWLDDVDANYLISTSWSESFAYNIAEAMAMGIKPVIRNFEAAEELWPTGCIYNSIEEAIDLFNEVSYESESYRQWVEDRYDSEREAKQYLDLFFGKEVK